MPYVPPTHVIWKDGVAGGTPIDAEDCNRWESNQKDSSDRIDTLTATSLKSYTHVQSTPQAVVTITHNLGRRPSVVSLFSLDYTQNYDSFQVTHLDANSLRISVDVPTAYNALIQ